MIVVTSVHERRPDTGTAECALIDDLLWAAFFGDELRTRRTSTALRKAYGALETTRREGGEAS